jgi:hypothetical protein
MRFEGKLQNTRVSVKCINTDVLNKKWHLLEIMALTASCTSEVVQDSVYFERTLNWTVVPRYWINLLARPNT